MVGNDKDWIMSGTRNYVSYTNLKSGDYEFRVRASNYDGEWNEKYTSLKIQIATPFYKTWWFILCSMIGIFTIIYSIYRNKIKINKEKEALRILYNKELAQLELKALRAQINPHFLFNSLNSINNFILKNDTKPIWLIEITAVAQQPKGVKINPQLTNTFKLMFDAGYSAVTADHSMNSITIKEVTDAQNGEPTILNTIHNFIFR